MNFDLTEEQKEIQKRFGGWSLLEHRQFLFGDYFEIRKRNSERNINAQILRVIDAIFEHLGARGIHAHDRDGDRGVIYEKYLERDQPQRFVIWLVDRDLMHQGRRRNCCELARALPTPY